MTSNNSIILFFIPILFVVPTVFAEDNENPCYVKPSDLNNIMVTVYGGHVSDCYDELYIYPNLQVIKEQNIVIIQQNAQLVKIGILNTCISQSAHDAVSPYWKMGNTLEDCEKMVREATK